MAMGTETFREMCVRVRLNCRNPYAVAYATAGEQLVRENADFHTCKVQALYVLSNLSHWRGDEAKAVKETLRAFVKSGD